MKALGERIKEYRNKLHISQEYVANYMGINRSMFCQLENGNRKLSAEEAVKLGELFGISTDTLLKGEDIPNNNVKIFARSFNNLDENDQAEIMNLIKFKERMKKVK